MNHFKKIVQSGYDKVSEVYRKDDFVFKDTRYEVFFNALLPYMKQDFHILDLGCGCGIPVSQHFSSDYNVTGVDISEVQIQRAQRLVPNANFICADMTQCNFKNESFDVILALYTVFHLPLDEQFSFLKRITKWLKNDAILVITVGNSAWTGIQENWRGEKDVSMYWCQADRNTYEKWLLDLGYEMIKDIFIPHNEGGHNTFIVKKVRNL